MGVSAVSRRTVSRATVEKWAWANLVANTLIILTGGAVRLTGSGLGCPTWPRCTDESFVPHGALAVTSSARPSRSGRTAGGAGRG